MKNYGIILLHLLFVFLLYQLFCFTGIINGFPDNTNLVVFDVGWYKTIIDEGYVFVKFSQTNLAFFPFFPYLWKFTRLSAVGISIINLGFTLIGFTLINRFYSFKTWEMLVFLSIPSLFFCFVPYSEASFYLFSAILLLGLYKESKILILIGLFLTGITRSAAIIFLPAIIFTELINCNVKKERIADTIRNISMYFSVILLSLLVVAFIQWTQTGKWFYFIKAQKYWDNTIRLPALPLTTTNPHRQLWLDGSALILGIFALIQSIIIFYKWIYLKFNFIVNKAFAFSLVYLSLVTLFTLFTHTKDNIGRTSIYSQNRFIFATPFFIVFILHYIRDKTLRNKDLLTIIPVIVLISISFGAFNLLINFDKYLLFNILLMLIYTGLYLMILFKVSILSKFWWLGIYTINTIFQVYMYNLFINEQFAG
jgi:hypothetical protein